MKERRGHILPTIIFSQLAGTSLWFSGNAVVNDLIKIYDLNQSATGQLTITVQVGFIIGTLLFAFFNISDKFSPRLIFLLSSLSGALFNFLVLTLPDSYMLILLFRFLVGFSLAGIYPIGIKIAAGWYEKGLGKALGFLVGALVLGTAFPHLLRSFGQLFEWTNVILFVSVFATLGGFATFLFIKDGPYIAKGAPFDPRSFSKIFAVRNFREAAFGYFGHMWELYAFWTFTPLLVSEYNALSGTDLNISLTSFFIIGAGSIGCVLGGFMSLKYGSAKVAFWQLAVSGSMCLLFYFMNAFTPTVFIILSIIWGIHVVGDSAQYSSITAKTAPKEYIGSAVTIVTSLGFAITIISIQVLQYLVSLSAIQWVIPILALGPLFGLISFYRITFKNELKFK